MVLLLDKYKEQLDFKSKNYEEIEAFVGDKPLVVSTKIDGILHIAKYLDGKTENATPTPSPQATVTGQVRIINKEEVDVYQQNSLTARIIGIATLGTTYPFYESTGNWYLIEYAMDKQGWIESKNTIEVNN